MNLPELTLRMSQARVAEFHRRAAQQRRLTGPESSRSRLVPVTIRYADSLDETALATLAALDSAEALTLPALVAEVEGDLRAALSLIDSVVIADPFHPTVELVALLQTRARQLALEPRAGMTARLRAPLRLARAVRLELRD
jgi:hypothetical protein